MATKYKKQKDGRYQTMVWDGTYKENGMKHQVRIYSDKSSKDLELKIAAYKESLKNGTLVVSSDIPFIEYAIKWLNTYKKVRERNTQIMYENIINKHFDAVNGIKISDFRRIHYQYLINDSISSPRTCQQIKLTIKQIIKSAISDKLLPADSLTTICDGVDIPKYKPSPKRALTDIEKKAITTANFTDKERAFVLIAFGCGLRRQEILALTVFDISVERHELTVNKALAFDGNNSTIKTTKSANGLRTVPMPDFLTVFLSDYIKTLNSTNLFEKTSGGLFTLSAYRRMWDSIISKMNIAAGGSSKIKIISGLTAHIFRHNYCANLCYQIPAISIKKIAQLLGDTEKMVIEVYNHILDEKEHVQDVIENAIIFEDKMKIKGCKKVL